MLFFRKHLTLEETQREIMEYLKTKNLKGIDLEKFEKTLLRISENKYPRYRTVKKLKANLERRISCRLEDLNKDLNDLELLFCVKPLFFSNKPVSNFWRSLSSSLNPLSLPIALATLIFVLIMRFSS